MLYLKRNLNWLIYNKLPNITTKVLTLNLESKLTEALCFPQMTVRENSLAYVSINSRYQTYPNIYNLLSCKNNYIN